MYVKEAGHLNRSIISHSQRNEHNENKTDNFATIQKHQLSSSK